MVSHQGRTCSVCSSPHKSGVEIAVISGISNRVIAGRFGLSESAVQRHIANHFRGEAPTLSGVIYESAPTDLLDRIREVADSSRNLRRAAEHTGNSLSVVRAAEAELRALAVMSDKLGVSNTDLLDVVQNMWQTISGARRLITKHPELGRELINLMDADATWGRDLFEGMVSRYEEKSKELK